MLAIWWVLRDMILAVVVLVLASSVRVVGMTTTSLSPSLTSSAHWQRSLMGKCPLASMRWVLGPIGWTGSGWRPLQSWSSWGTEWGQSSFLTVVVYLVLWPGRPIWPRHVGVGVRTSCKKSHGLFKSRRPPNRSQQAKISSLQSICSK